MNVITRNCFAFLCIFHIAVTSAAARIKHDDSKSLQNSTSHFCACGVFLSDQFVKGSRKPPIGDPVVVTEIEQSFCSNTILGVKSCTNKCLNMVPTLAKFLPNSNEIICASIDRDCHGEKVHLFVNNCDKGWVNTNHALGRRFCCKDGEYYKCPNAVN